MEVFKLFGSIFVDNEKANDSIAKTDEKASSLGEKFAKGAKTAAQWGAGIVTAASGVVTAGVSAAKQAADMADVVDKASIRMGISAESYQELSYAAGQCGVEMSTMEKAAKSLEGTDLNMDDAMAQIMALGTAEERSAKAAELFGESVAYKMAPLLEEGEDGFNALTDRAHELGLVMSDEAVANGVEFGDLLSDLQQTVQHLGSEIGSALLPIANDLITQIIDFMPMIKEIIDSLAPVMVDMVSQLIPPLMDIAQQILPIVLNLVSALLPIVSQLLVALMPIITDFLDAFMPIIQPIIDILVDLLDIIVPPLTAVIKVLAAVLNSALAGAVKSLEPILKGLVTWLDGIISFIQNVFTGNWEGAWKSVVQIFKGIFDGIIGIAKAPINAVINMFNSLFDKIGAIKIPDWVPDWLGGGKTLQIPHIPLLAEGGDITSTGSAIVGEAGPELVSLPQGARVTPLGGEGFEAKMDRVLSLMEEFMPLVGQGRLVLDTGVVAGAMAPAMNKELGRLASRGARL